MKILHVVAGLWENTGGPAEVIPNLCLSLTRLGVEVDILTVDGAHSKSLMAAHEQGVGLYSFPAKYIGGIRYTPGISQYLSENSHKYDIIHNHGHWLHPNWSACFYAKKNKIPFVTTPNGTLVSGMLKRSRMKKLVAWMLFDKHIIKYAKVIHSLSEFESHEMGRKIKKQSQKIRVIPNGVFPPSQKSTDSLNKLQKVLKPKNEKILLFLSRVHPIKGIIDLLDAWCTLDNPDWKLVVVGPVEDEISGQVNAAMNTANVNIIGPVYGDERFDYFQLADAYILPSYAEGLPTALLEAASFGLPIIYTHECNFEDLEKVNGGILTSTGENSITSALSLLFDMPDEDLTKMSNRAKALIDDKYNWDNVAKNWFDCYQRVSNCL